MNKLEYKVYKNCRFCGSKKTEKVIDLGKTPLAGGFIKNIKDFDKEKKYPLELRFCMKCFLVQNTYSINPKVLFRNYFYFSSSIKTLVDHFKSNASEFYKLIPEKSFVVEIGSNDGSFLKAIEKKGAKILGIDPAKNVSDKALKNGVPTVNLFFSEETAMSIVNKHGQADLIFSSNTLAHIQDMHTVLKGIYILLKEDGKLIFEVHYLPDLVKNLQYDMIYHEHEYYYSLLSLEKFLNKFGLKIYDAKKIPIHGGSIQIYASKNMKIKQTSSLLKLIKTEKTQKINDINTYLEFDLTIKKAKKDLGKLIDRLKKNNKIVMGYGASGRGTIIANYCNLDHSKLEFVIDDAPAKIGNFLPGTHQKIISSEILNTDEKPDYVILFAWSFADEISKKNNAYLRSGGKFIIPLPKPRII